MNKTVLIVEDDETQRVMLDMFLRSKMGIHAHGAENGRKALDILSSPKGQHIKLIIADIQMPVMDGFELLRRIKERHSHIPVLMLTSSQNKEDATTCISLGAADFISKPYDAERMIVTINNLMHMQSLNAEVERLKQDNRGEFRFSNLIGYDGGLSPAIHKGKKACLTHLPCLITGETGTGKELFAKAIHGESKQANGPFIAVNCGAIPSELVESTLFGHEKGAFTGATDQYIGKFREANGGTIFLDEVGELPLDAQVKLLRVLQEMEVEPVGAPRAVKINVRIIAATHRDLKQDVANGLFREDLYYRLNVLHIDIPPLRKRIDDIDDLVQYFMHAVAIDSGLPPKTISNAGFNHIKNHQWPGNVRELENTIHRAFIMSDHMVLTPDDFIFDGGEPHHHIDNHHTDVNADANAPIHLPTFQDMEKNLIRQSLAHYDGNVTAAAKAINIAKSTFYRKMVHYGISGYNQK